MKGKGERISERMGERRGERMGEKMGEKRYEGKRETAIYRVRSPRQTAENDVKHPEDARKCPCMWAFCTTTGRRG